MNNSNWQHALAQGFSNATALLEFLGLPNTLACSSAEAAFKTRVPLSFAKKMRPGDPNDPLLKQVLAIKEETFSPAGFCAHPLREQEFNPTPGLIHKYKSRVLFIMTRACPIHCRYCFRREFPYQDNNPGQKGWEAALNYIHNDPDIHEVILSGGDPLLAPDQILFELIARLEQIKHLHTLRIHTRIPVVFPERITSELLSGLENVSLKRVIVLHVNHPAELDASIVKVCEQLKIVGCTLLNQSVILAGINDDAATLTTLSHRLFDCGVLPYYLHVLDKVKGSAHFDCEPEHIRSIYQTLQASLPGYLVPKLVQEVPGAAHKILFR